MREAEENWGGDDEDETAQEERGAAHRGQHREAAWRLVISRCVPRLGP